MKVKDFTELVEKIAPLGLQEEYDNAGLIIGSPEMTVSGILLSLDTTENVIDEAIRNNCNLIIAHHPVIFKGLKKINGNSYVERTVIKAIQHNIAIYAAHTNLDNVLTKGVNEKIAQKLGLNNLSILRPKSGNLSKLTVYGPAEYAEKIKNSLFESGAGEIGNYSECSFTAEGTGSFKPNAMATPFSGKTGERKVDREVKIEVIIYNGLINSALKNIKSIHPYEEVAYDILPLKNINQTTGSGIVGFLEREMESAEFLNHLKENMKLELVKYTAYSGKIRKVAICGGAGSFLIPDASAAKADAYVTADLKYHEYFDAESRFMLCDIGHYESEIYTLEIFCDVIKEKYPTFAVIFCKENTNPIQYFK